MILWIRLRDAARLGARHDALRVAQQDIFHGCGYRLLAGRVHNDVVLATDAVARWQGQRLAHA